MSAWRISIIMMIFLIVCVYMITADEQINNRPTRPEIFKNVDEVKDYVARMKAYIATSNRFGKRFSPIKQYQPQDRYRLMPRPWRSMYDLLENYEAM